MTPFDYAQRVVNIDCTNSRLFVVNLSNEQMRIALSVSASSQRADHIALIARQIVAHEIAAAMRDEDCRCAAAIDEAYLARAKKIWWPSQAAQICRVLATRQELNTLGYYTSQLHTNELHNADGEKDRLKPT